MAQTIVILCDECLEGGSEVPGRTYALTVTVPDTRPTPYEIDACDMHAEPFRAMVKMLGEYGRRTDRKTPLPRISTAGERTAPPSSGDGLTCRVCGHGIGSEGGLKSHLQHQHGISLAEMLGQAKIPCPAPGCTRKFKGKQGVSGHLRSPAPLGHGMSVEAAREMRLGARE